LATRVFHGLEPQSKGRRIRISLACARHCNHVDDCRRGRLVAGWRAGKPTLAWLEGSGNMRYAQTMAFTTLVFFSFLTVFKARSDKRSAFNGLFSNKWLWGAVLMSLALQATVIYVPLLQQAFSTVPLSAGDWLFCAGVASSVLLLRELTKVFSRTRT